MKKGVGITLMLILSIFLFGCESIDVSKISDEDMQRIAEKTIVCKQPYIRFETGCCIDKNNNSICDNDEIKNIIDEVEPQIKESDTTKEIENKTINITKEVVCELKQIPYEVEETYIEQECKEIKLDYEIVEEYCGEAESEEGCTGWLVEYDVFNMDEETGDFSFQLSYVRPDGTFTDSNGKITKKIESKESEIFSAFFCYSGEKIGCDIEELNIDTKKECKNVEKTKKLTKYREEEVC